MNADQPVPPQDLGAEDAVLGACLLGPKPADRVLELIDPAWLYRESQALILHAVARLRMDGIHPDAVAVIGELTRAGQLEQVGGETRIRELVYLTPTAANAAHYVGLVRDAWLKRQIIRRVGQVQELAWNGAAATEALEALELAALDVAHKADTGRASSVWTGLDADADLAERLANPVDEDETGITAPFSFLLPFQSGRLYVLGGYAGDGKTAVAIQAFRRAAEAGARVGFVTLEMTKRDLRDRLIATFGVPYLQVRSGRVDAKYAQALANGRRLLHTADVAFVDDARTADAIVRTQRVRRFDLLIVDHLHRLRVEVERASELRIEVERAVAAMTDLALAEEIPVLLLAQLHRPSGRDDFPRPTMQSFRETGKIEQEASLVWVVWRKREDGERSAQTDFLVLKNRYGGDGAYPLQFRGSEVRFVEVERQ